jgi:hypothetical protein
MHQSLPTERCCKVHTSWDELADHLVQRFPQIRDSEVVDVVVRSRRAAEDFDLPEDEHLETVELMARYQLLQLSGEMATTVRLDPESHRRKTDA